MPCPDLAGGRRVTHIEHFDFFSWDFESCMSCCKDRGKGLVLSHCCARSWCCPGSWGFSSPLSDYPKSHPWSYQYISFLVIELVLLLTTKEPWLAANTIPRSGPAPFLFSPTPTWIFLKEAWGTEAPCTCSPFSLTSVLKKNCFFSDTDSFQATVHPCFPHVVA